MDQSLVDYSGTAALLRAGYRASLAGHAGAVVAALGHGPGRWVALGAWGWLIYLQLRVSLDAELFSMLAAGTGVGEMDGFLVRSGLIGRARERSAGDRCRGALRLWKLLLFVLVIELVAAVIGLQ